MENIFDLKKNYSEAQLYERFIALTYRDIYRFIYVIVRNSHLAEDVLQETLIQGYKHFSDLKDKDKFKAWMCTIAKREALKALKKYLREQNTEHEEIEKVVNKDFYMHDFMKSSPELHDQLSDIINSFDGESRDIIYMVYYADLSLNEISVILNININTVKSKHRRIKQRIYRELVKRKLTKSRQK
jgi:RNA polymerase sigma-70 factor, ECF subfamily